MNKQNKSISVLSLLTSILSGRKSRSVSSPKGPPPSPSHHPNPHGRYAYAGSQISPHQPWRKEHEIDTKRQEELSKCRTIVCDVEKGIYPFKGIELSRADIEWLLATQDGGLGPIDWNDESQRERKGLDLRGAVLRRVDLSKLPLAGMQGGIGWYNGMLA